MVLCLGNIPTNKEEGAELLNPDPITLFDSKEDVYMG